MEHSLLNLNEPPNEDGFERYVMLTKDGKDISRIQCLNPPFEMFSDWSISNIVRPTTKPFLSGLPHCFLRPAPQNSHQQREWREFMGFLQNYNKVAIVRFGSVEFYILPPEAGANFSHAKVAYQMEKAQHTLDDLTYDSSVPDETLMGSPKLVYSDPLVHTNGICRGINTCMNNRLLTPLKELATPRNFMAKEAGDDLDANVRGRGSDTHVGMGPLDLKFPQAIGDHYARESRMEAHDRSQPIALKKYGCLEKNFVRTDPSYLRTLGQSHSGWIFGAIAELIDNSRDAKATDACVLDFNWLQKCYLLQMTYNTGAFNRLDISIESLYLKKAGKEIPVLSIFDNGHGMSHHEVVRMLSFGHKQPDGDDPDHIGRFGIGFKTGAMRLGRDAIVLTQTTNTRSVAFLSQSFNEGKYNLEIPIVSYCRQGRFMEEDLSIQSKELAIYNLDAIKEFSPFNEYLVGDRFLGKETGTQIYIWNLDEWGSDYCLEWQTGKSGTSSFHQGDILIRSRRIRSRPGQISRKVPLDYSLRSYLEVIFLDPRMRISVQGSLVKSRPLAKLLSKTDFINGDIMGKPVQLTLGRCQLEWEQMNCGIFLYWHGRLIEAYKRVGGMVHNADMGRGVIGVIDVTDVMNDGNGHVWVHSNKQGFQDCEAYAKLEEWLGNRSDEYWDKNFDMLHLKKGNALYKPDHEWVQCDKCRKWRILNSSFDIRDLPQQWFCYMKPYNGRCETPEQQMDRGVITVAAKRTGHHSQQKRVDCKKTVQKVNSESISEDDSEDDSSQTVEEDVHPRALKRLRKGLPKSCKKI
ncbi:hypothetical protein HHK36_010506 [Tetracentron sinense]|uniref:CW-type domain-containing protein n=1 Tax=Tetracentron sinense TaxID=13715 RepID=A0A834ZE53_TETSI|nr:hypothetical protein HHK36_010506 [Tetracentron sinense]